MIATLVFNDHWLKAHHPSWLTGKLSDAAGLVFFPFVLASLLPIRDVRRAVLVATIATAIGFALVKTLPAATDMYCHALGALQWLVHPWARYAPVAAVVDPTDLLASSVPGGSDDGDSAVARRRYMLASAAMRLATLLIIAMGCGGAAPTTPAEPTGVTCQPGPTTPARCMPSPRTRRCPVGRSRPRSARRASRARTRVA